MALAAFAHIATPQIRLTRDPNTVFFFLDHLGARPPFRLEDDTTWNTDLEQAIAWGLRILEKDEEMHGASPNAQRVPDALRRRGLERRRSPSRSTAPATRVCRSSSSASAPWPATGCRRSRSRRASRRCRTRSRGSNRASLQRIADTAGGRYFELDRDADRDIANARFAVSGHVDRRVVRVVRRRRIVEVRCRHRRRVHDRAAVGRPPEEPEEQALPRLQHADAFRTAGVAAGVGIGDQHPTTESVHVTSVLPVKQLVEPLLLPTACTRAIVVAMVSVNRRPPTSSGPWFVTRNRYSSCWPTTAGSGGPVANEIARFAFARATAVVTDPESFDPTPSAVEPSPSPTPSPTPPPRTDPTPRSSARPGCSTSPTNTPEPTPNPPCRTNSRPQSETPSPAAASSPSPTHPPPDPDRCSAPSPNSCTNPPPSPSPAPPPTPPDPHPAAGPRS